MIVMFLVNSIFAVIKGVLSLINIPSAGAEFNKITLFIIDLFGSATSLVGFFIPWDIVRFGLPIVILLVNAEHIYHFIMWILKKIPMLGIE